jgi:nucleoside-diphosphate-sugar epimerase
MQEPKSKTWIVTGASGRIGKMVMRRWQLQPPPGIVFVPQYRRPTPGGLLWNMVSGPDQLERWISANGPVDGLLVLSGATPKPGANMQDNLDIVQAAINAAKSTGIKRMLVASSSAVYGTGGSTALTEAMPAKPETPYGAVKAAAEALCKNQADAGLDITCMRIGNVAGADALLGANQSTPIKLDQFPDGHGPLRSYIGPETFADVMTALALFSGRLPPVLNIAAQKPVTMQALLEAAQMPWTFVTAGAGAAQSVVLNTELLGSLFDFGANAAEAAEMIRQLNALAPQPILGRVS